jgi:hypothetical protein
MRSVSEVCFCGCGRRVRFTKKRLSRHGAQADATLAALRNISAKLVSSDADATAKLQRFIEHGEEIRNLYRDIIHGVAHAPPVGSFQTQIFAWERDARGLVQAHRRLLDEAEKRPDFQESVDRHRDRHRQPGDVPILTEFQGRTGTFMVVDMDGAQAALNSWTRSNPTASQEEYDVALRKACIANAVAPDPNDDTSGNYIVVELDSQGRIIRQP